MWVPACRVLAVLQIASVLSVALLLQPAVAQPFKVAGGWKSALPEPGQRRASGGQGIIFDFNTATPAFKAPNGNIKENTVTYNPFLSTLNNDGASQILITLGPCAATQVHIHPRAVEQVYVSRGSRIQAGIISEDSTLFLRNMSEGQTVTTPQGLLHWQYNLACDTATLLANFPTKDPGFASIWHSTLSVPNEVLNAVTSIPEAQWAELKRVPAPLIPVTCGTECLRRCGKNFTTANSFLNVSAAVAADSAARG